MSVFSGFANIGKVPELRKRVLFTLGMLAVYRIGVFVTIPGVDRNVMQAVMRKQGGGLLGLFNMFSGGALANLSIFALGIMPYVSASIILQLLAMVYKPLDELRKEGEQGTRKINQYTRYGTIVAVADAGLRHRDEPRGRLNNGDLGDAAHVGDVVTHAGWGFRLMTHAHAHDRHRLHDVGRRADHRARHRQRHLAHHLRRHRRRHPERRLHVLRDEQGEHPAPEPRGGRRRRPRHGRRRSSSSSAAQRQIPIYYARRTVGRRVYGGQTAHLPLRVNTVGHDPADLRLVAPDVPGDARRTSTSRGWRSSRACSSAATGCSTRSTSLLIIFFCYFYTAVTFQPVDVADNLKKQQAFIPSIRQGKQTADYIDYVLTRITFGGALYVAAVCVVPSIISEAFHVPFRWGGTSIMIVVGVALDTVSQIEAHLITRNYEGLSGGGGKATRIRGRRDC